MNKTFTASCISPPESFKEKWDSRNQTAWAIHKLQHKRQKNP
jgi:hypothetical protein